MNDESFKLALAHVLKMEGSYSCTPGDLGGETNFGITHTTYDAYLTKAGLPKQSVKYITADEVSTIYYNSYWLASNCDTLPGALQGVIFQSAVNMGCSIAKKLLQRALLIAEENCDGQIGPSTMAELAKCNLEATVARFALFQLKYYCDIIHGNNSQVKFIGGWSNRAIDIVRTIFK